MGDSFGLKRVLGLGDLVAIEVGTTVGAGIFSLTALAATMAGPAVPLAYVAAAIPIIFIMMTVGMLGSAMPTVGGTYRYPSRLYSPGWATVGVWCYALGLVFGALPMYATECVNYLKPIFPGIWPKTAAIGLLTFFYVLNLVGISIAASIQALMVVVLIVALLVFGFAGAPTIDPTHFDHLFSSGAGGFVLAACILTFALQGSNSVIELGAEIKRPGRNIPLSLLIAIPLVSAIYIFVAVAAIGNYDISSWKALLDAKQDANLTQPAAVFLSRPGFVFFLVGGAFLAFTTTLNGTMMWATKSLMVVAADGIMPPFLARTDKKGTPVVFLTILWALAVVAVLIGAGLPTFASYATIGGMVIFIPSMIAAWLLPRRARALYDCPGFRLRGFMFYFAPAVGILISVLLILILLVDLGWWCLPFVGWLLIGIVFYLVRKKTVEKAAGKSFDELMRADLARMIADCRAVITEDEK